MAIIHELNITNFTDTGLTTPFSRYTFDLELKYRDDAGVERTHNQSYTFPNDLASMPLAVRRRFAEQMIDAMVRVTLGIETWDSYR